MNTHHHRFTPLKRPTSIKLRKLKNPMFALDQLLKKLQWALGLNLSSPPHPFVPGISTCLWPWALELLAALTTRARTGREVAPRCAGFRTQLLRPSALLGAWESGTTRSCEPNEAWDDRWWRDSKISWEMLGETFFVKRVCKSKVSRTSWWCFLWHGLCTFRL